MDLRKEIQVALNSCQPNTNRVDKIEAIAKKYAENYQALQLQQTGVSGSDILEAINESMELIDYMHQLTVIPNNMHEDYANRFANTMSLLATLRNHYR